MLPPTELPEAIIGSLMAALGLLAIAFGALRLPARDRAAFWFGLFALMYGVRLLGDSDLIRALVPLTPAVWRYREAVITYTILVPAVLFVESLLGSGWRRIVRRTWQALLVWGVAAITYELATGRPESLMWLNPPAVVLMSSIVTVHVLASVGGRTIPREGAVVMAAGLLFGAVAVGETLIGRGFLGPWEMEPLAMLVFVCALAYLVARRALATEQRLLVVSRELSLAREIQQSILPRDLPRVAGLQLAARFLPMTDVAGDLYDVVERGPSQLGILVADVSGHGVPAALVASMVKIAFAAEIERLDDPGLALQGMNRTLWAKFDRAYVTAFVALLDPVAGRLKYASAGHPPALLRHGDGRVEPLKDGNVALTFFPGVRYATSEVALAPGDRVVLFTDGLLEAANVVGDFFGDARLGKLVADSTHSDPDQFAHHLVHELHSWIGSTTQLQDDVTLVVADLTTTD
jgi:phosphoserine phosphatase RsbU/P